MIPKIKSRGRKRKSIEKRDQKDSPIQKDKKADIIIKRKIQLLLTSDDRQEIAPGARVDDDLLNPDKTPDWLFDGLMIKRKNEKDFRSFVDQKWFNQTEKILELWKAYKPEKKITVDEIISNISEDKGEEEEEINDLLENENEMGDKSSKVHKKQPIKEFNVNGWESLDEEGKMILKEHFNELFNETITYQEQLKLVHSLIYSPIKSSRRGYSTIASLFGISKGSAFNTLQRLQYAKMPIGRPTIFIEEEMILLSAKIRSDWDNHNPPTLSILNSWIYLKFHKLVTNNTLAHTLIRFKLGKTIIGYPTELKRIEVPLSIILEHYEKLNELLKAMIPTAFIYNVDECGFQSWADKITEKVVVPTEVEETSTNIGIDRASRRATLIGCVCADGSALKPFIIITRKTKEKALEELGYGQNVVEVVFQANGFVTGPLFDYWSQTIFFPEVKEKRIKYQYQGPVLLLFDGCTAHSSDFFLDECTYNDVIPIQEPASSSDQVQVLDIGIFGVQKNIIKSLKSQDDCSPCTNQIISIVDSWQKATIRSNVTSAFRQAGFVYLEIDSKYYASVDPKKARSIRGIDHEENHLSPESKKRIPILKF